MDPIAFFDHLAANSTTSRSSHSEVRSAPVISLDTVRQSQEGTWNHFIQSYRTEAKVLSDYLKDQFVALDQVEEYFDQSHTNLQQKIETSFQQLQNDLNQHQSYIQTERLKHEREKELIAEVCKFQDEKIKLNVGGQLFQTSLTTLRKDPNSMLAQMFSENSSLKPDADNSYFIDRDSTYFRLVLNYLRDLKIPAGIVDDPKVMDELMQEARFYKLNDLLKLKWKDLPVISQEQLHQLYPPITTNNAHYRTTIMQLERKNLSNLDFSNYHLDPKSKFTESNLENANFTQTKFGFDFDHQIDFSCVQMKLEGAIL
ncbi:hypothetical protein HPULCUR_000402 [Helicostylum pulchrum]|uniref:BTB domain-containing protein n=1 Tax=Helicostylum pulchrum TaxID=562976 RepID=A0ABP9XJT0_9FUNG